MKKYPKTYHLPFSEGLQNDDRCVTDEAYEVFKSFNVVISEKMDGENSSVYTNNFHARSLDSNNHSSRNWIKGYVANFQWRIPIDWRFVFENCFAAHTIVYEDLSTYAFLLNIWNANNECLSWEDTKHWVKDFDLITPHIYYEGPYDEKIIKDIWVSLDKTKVEGLVVRNIDSFHYKDFQSNVLKLVRKGHVQTDSIHWLSKPVISNKLAILVE